MTTRPHLRLGTWLAILVAGIVVPLLGITGLEFWSVLDANERERDAALSSRARAIASAVDAEIRAWRGALYALAESTDLRSGRLRDFAAAARAVAARHNGWVVAIDATGQQVVNTLLPADAPLPRTAAGHMVEAVFRDGKAVTEFTFGAAAQRHIISNAVPVRRDGRVILCLAMNLGPEQLTRLLELQRVPSTWVAAVNDRQNRVVARSSEAEKRVGKQGPEALRQAVAEAEAGLTTYALMDGRQARVAFQWLTEVPWFVVLAVPSAELPSTGPLVRFGWTAALLGLVVVAVAGLVGGTIARPIRRLAELAPTLSQPGAGPVDVGSRVQEVWDLQQALVAGAQQVQASAREREQAAAALREANEALELRVAERTGALRQSTERFRLLSDVASRLLQTRDPQELVDELCTRVMAHLDCQVFFNFVVDPPSGRLRLAACAGIPDADAERIRWLDTGAGVCGCVARDGCRIVIGDILRNSDPRAALVRSFGIQAYACHPLLAGARVLGTLSFGSTTRTRFAPDELALMKTVADQVAIAMERMERARDIARLNLGLERRNAELQAIFETVPIGLAITVGPLGHHIRGNPALEQMLDLPPGGELSKAGPAAAHYRVFRDGRELEARELPMQRAIRGEAVPSEVLDITLKDGRRLAVYASGSPLFDEQGKPRGAVGAFLDITLLRVAEAALKESEARLRLQIERMPIACILHDADFRIREWNPAAERLFGFTAAEAIGRNPLELLVAPTACEVVQGVFRRIEMGDMAAHLINENVTKDGRQLLCEWTNAPIRDDQGRIAGLLSMAQDVTERRRAEREVEAARAAAVTEQRRLEAVMQALPVGVTILDAQGGVLRANAAYEEIWGGPRPPVTRVEDYEPYRAWWPETGEPVRPEEWASARAVQKGETVVGQQLAIERFDGRRVFVLNSAAPIVDGESTIVGSAVAIQDITALKRAEEEVRSLARFPKENPSPILRLSGDGVILYANEVAAAVLDTWGCRVGDRAPAAWPETVRRGLETGQRSVVDLVCGERRFLLAVTPVPEAGYVNLYGSDVTEQKRAEEALRQAHDRLEVAVQERTVDLSRAVEALRQQATQLRALTAELTLAEQRERRRLATLLHDGLQQLLVAARLRAQMLGRTEDAEVRQGSREIEELLAEAMADARSLSGELSPPTLQRGALLPALEWLARRMREKHRFTVTLHAPADAMPALPEDLAVQLYQGVREFLFNAVKHAQVAAAEMTIAKEDGILTLTVTDAGVGFDPHRLLVEGGNEGGFGLLAIRERLGLVGGCLEIASAPGRGSRFTVRVPLKPESPASAVPPSSVAPPAAPPAGVGA